MKIYPLHPWDVSTEEAVRIQQSLACRIRLRGGSALPALVAGADLGFSHTSQTIYAGVVLLKFPSLELVAKFTLQGRVTFPYVPGLLSFREAPLLLELFKKVRPTPGLLMFDGQGLAHPRRFGLACHLGLLLDLPAIGCAKSRLVGRYEEPGNQKGDCSPLVDETGKRLGTVIRTREKCKPLFVSPGHRISHDNAVRRTLECTTRYRIPEPTRLAHNLVTELRRRDLDP
ncbi:MAG: deoxyribonuclease V [Nitrospinae bacterium CG11_big_fil_rev_8_21_14_0_20_56_8]|nr:MAG: deoxyribonuclease V [Nitrospinae bacterium CG11_big_fil_rev_8_21_14_0_20_56_8]